jgi:hypothetical protein
MADALNIIGAIRVSYNNIDEWNFVNLYLLSNRLIL